MPPAHAAQAGASDIISLLAMTNDDDKRECLAFYKTGSNQPMGSWGHEYVRCVPDTLLASITRGRHLAAEAADEFKERAADQPTDDLVALAAAIIPYFMAHNAEADACDLLMEVRRRCGSCRRECAQIEQLGMLLEHVDVKAYPRVTLYLMSCVPYVPGVLHSVRRRR